MMPLFKSRSTDGLAAIGPKLEAARATLAAAEAELRERSVDCALEDDPAAALRPYPDAVATARSTIDALEIAEAELNRQEQQRLARARADAEKSRVRAVAQHVGSLFKHSAAFRDATERQIAEYGEMKKAAGKIAGLLRNDEGKELFGFNAGGTSALEVLVDRHVLLELARIGKTTELGASDVFPPPVRGAYAGLLRYAQPVSAAAPIDILLRQKLGTITAYLSGERPAPPVAEKPREVIDPPETTEFSDAALPRQSAAPRAPAILSLWHQALAAHVAGEEVPAEVAAALAAGEEVPAEDTRRDAAFEQLVAEQTAEKAS